MGKVKKVFDTIKNKIKDIYVSSIKDSNFLELTFFSFLFVMLVLSIMGICVAMSSNKYKSAVLNDPLKNGEIKEFGNGGFITGSDDGYENNEDDTQNNNPDNNQDDGQNSSQNGNENNDQENNSGNNNAETNQGSTPNNGGSSNGSSGNNGSSNNQSSNGNSSGNTNPNSGNSGNSGNNSSSGNSSSSGNNPSGGLNSGSENNNKENSGGSSQNPVTENPPAQVLSITCTASNPRNIKSDGTSYIAEAIEQVTAKFDKESKTFYRADVSLSLEYKNKVDNLENLQNVFEKELKKLAGYFNKGNSEVVFSAPTTAYVSLKDLDYDSYYTGYRKETKNYDSFYLTFSTAGYMCTK